MILNFLYCKANFTEYILHNSKRKKNYIIKEEEKKRDTGIDTNDHRESNS